MLVLRSALTSLILLSAIVVAVCGAPLPEESPAQRKKVAASDVLTVVPRAVPTSRDSAPQGPRGPVFSEAQATVAGGSNLEEFTPSQPSSESSDTKNCESGSSSPSGRDSPLLWPEDSPPKRRLDPKLLDFRRQVGAACEKLDNLTQPLEDEHSLFLRPTPSNERAPPTETRPPKSTSPMQYEPQSGQGTATPPSRPKDVAPPLGLPNQSSNIPAEQRTFADPRKPQKPRSSRGFLDKARGWLC